ncbi:MAG: hypothetical protein AAGF47_02660 [Planctomycetota bacterium]
MSTQPSAEDKEHRIKQVSDEDWLANSQRSPYGIARWSAGVVAAAVVVAALSGILVGHAVAAVAGLVVVAAAVILSPKTFLMHKLADDQVRVAEFNS